MKDTQPYICTEYKSLYPTDSTNQDIAIPRIAANRSDSGDARIRRQEPSRNQASIDRPRDLMPVQRIFQPHPDALNELVEVLHRILLDVPESGQTAPCFSVAPEQ